MLSRRHLLIGTLGLGPVWQQRGTMATPDTPVEAAAEPALVDAVPDKLPSVVEFLPDRHFDAWDDLASRVQACQSCGLAGMRTQTVFERGHRGASWFIVGEAPGEQEDRQGLPFVGAAGQLLDQMLLAAGLDLEKDVYIANVLKCRPPANRNPQAIEVQACQHYLHQQIQLVQPKVILALGRFAAQTLLDTDRSIGQLRNTVHTWRNMPLIVSYHPAYLLRSLPEKAKAWQDLCLARRHLAAMS